MEKVIEGFDAEVGVIENCAVIIKDNVLFMLKVREESDHAIF
jgi:hypothetical protein